MKRRARRIAFLLAVSLAAIAAPSLLARPAFAQDDATLQMARERFQEGVKFYDAKQYDKARLAFLQAYALKKHPAVLLNLAQSELRSSHEVDAAKHFSQFLRESKEASAAEKQEAEKGLSTAKAGVYELTINVDSADADVYVDGSPEGRSPLGGAVFVKPGAHNVEARKDGKTASSSVTAIAGQTGSVDLRFSGGGAAPVGPMPPPPGSQGAAPPPGPTTGPEPAPTGPPPGPGPEADTGGKPGFFQWAGSNKVAWIGAGLTVVGLGAGVGFALASKSNYDAADSAKSQILAEARRINTVGKPCDPSQNTTTRQHYASACATYQDRVDKGDRDKTLSTVSFVVAGAAAAGTVIYYFIDTGSHSAKIGKRNVQRPEGFSATVLPYVGAHDSGIGVFGQF
jgi:hypothetical protein